MPPAFFQRRTVSRARDARRDCVLRSAMPYGCEVARIDRRTIVLHVTPEQADCEPFYTRADFALALLLGEMRPNPLRTALGERTDPIELQPLTFDPSPYIAAVDVRVVRRGEQYGDTDPVAAYTIEVTDARWIGHLARGDRYDSYAYYAEAAPCLADHEVFVPNVRQPVGSYATGQRVAIRPHLEIWPGQIFGRGTIEDQRRATQPPPGWDGGLLAYRIALDHGPHVWAFAETVREVPADTYECAWAAPDTYFDELLALRPLERARALRWLGLYSGGALRIERDAGRPFELDIAGRAPWLHGLLRRLPRSRAAYVAIRLLAEWLDDSHGLAMRCSGSERGTEMFASETFSCPGHYEYATPLDIVIGALTLIIADPPARIPPAVAAKLERALDAYETVWLGTPAHTHKPRAAYLREACRGTPPALPSTLFLGLPHQHAEAAALGLAGGALVVPSSIDLHRP